MCLKFDVWLGHLHLSSSSEPDAFPSAERVINTGVSMCTKVSASASTLAGKTATGWGRDQSRTHSTQGGSSDISLRDVLSWKSAIQTRKKSTQSRISRPHLDEEVETACWTTRRSEKPSYLSRSASSSHSWSWWCATALLQHPPALLFLLGRGQRGWFCGQPDVPPNGTQPTNKSRLWRFSSQSGESGHFQSAGSQGRLTL